MPKKDIFESIALGVVTGSDVQHLYKVAKIIPKNSSTFTTTK